jgi:hypothetical protein
MEMLDVKAAKKLLDGYTSMLELGKILHARLREQLHGTDLEDDPELATHDASLTESLRTIYREYAIFSIMLSEMIQEQGDLVLMHEDGVSLIPAQQRLNAKLGEIEKYLGECKQGQTPPKSADTNAASTQTTGSGVP